MNASALVLALSVLGQPTPVPMPPEHAPVLSRPAAPAPMPTVPNGQYRTAAPAPQPSYGPLHPQAAQGYGYAEVAGVGDYCPPACAPEPCPEYAGCQKGRRPCWLCRGSRGPLCRACARPDCPGVPDPSCCICFCGGRCCLYSTCDLYPHYAYLPTNFGYYYFRPYNWSHIRVHQEIAGSWGLDPSNPYSRVYFEQLYSDRPRAVVSAPVALPAEERLPLLESLLEPMP